MLATSLESNSRSSCINDDSVRSHRDHLVQQLLEERRQRLEQKLAAEAKHDGVFVEAFSTPAVGSAATAFEYTADESGRTVPAKGPLNRGASLGDYGPRRLEAVLGGVSSTPPQSRRQPAPEMSGQRYDLHVASDIWSPAELDEPNEFTFASLRDEPSSSSSRSRSMERRSMSPRVGQASSTKPASCHQPKFVGSVRSNSQSKGQPIPAAAAQRRPQSAPRTGHRSVSVASAVAGQTPTKAKLANPPNSAARELSTSQRKQSAVQESRRNSLSSRSSSAPPGRRASNGHDFNRKLQEWSMRQQLTEMKQQQARQENDTKAMEQCTFKPDINSKSEFYARRARGCYVEPLVERLHHEADKRMILRQKAKDLMDADEMCSYTFQPQIKRTGACNENERPLYLRSEELRQQRQEKSTAREAMEAVRSDCSFHPRISDKSVRIVEKKRDEMKFQGTVEERLYAGAQDLQQRRMSMQNSSFTDSQATPSVDDVSRRICKSSVYFQGPQQDFVTRQRTFELAKQRRHEVRSQHADSEYTFKPEISDTSRHMVSSNIELVGETAEERVHRLAVRDVERRDQIRGAMEEFHYRECTFKPSLNPHSQMLATKFDDVGSFDSLDPGARVHERLYKMQQNRSRCSDDSKLDECTFAPAISSKSSKRYAHVKSRYGCSGQQIMDNIHEELSRKEEYLNEKRREIESEEVAKCTFNPGIRRPYEEPDQAVIVSGLGRFFELRDLARRKQEEQQARETKVFHPETKAWSDGITIPEPFALSRGFRDTYQDANSTPIPEECTFAPKTTESDNRQLLHEIMGSEAPLGEFAFENGSKYGGCNFHDLTYRRSPPASAYSPAGA